MAAVYPALDSCPHNAEWECATCTTARHAVEHPAGDDDECPVCRHASLTWSGRFLGAASTSDSMQAFWSTGDPGVFDAQERRAAGAREERRTRIG